LTIPILFDYEDENEDEEDWGEERVGGGTHFA